MARGVITLLLLLNTLVLLCQEPEKEALIGLSIFDLYGLGVIGDESFEVSQLPPSQGSMVVSEFCDEQYIPIDSTYIPVPRNDDGSLYIEDIGFVFNFCESSFSDLYINTNGNLSFTQAVGQFSPNGFPYNVPMVAPFWADVDTRNTDCGQAYYKLFGDHMIVTWDSVGWFSNHCDPLNSFQVIISDGMAPIIGVGNNIQFRYLDMNWTTGTASGGGPFGGVPATVGYNSGNNMNYEQIGRFNLDNSNYDGPYGNNDGVHYLDKNCFSFNADLTEEYDINLVCIDTTVYLNSNCQYTVDIFHIAEFATNGCYAVDIVIDPEILTCDDLGMNVLDVTVSNAFSTETCTVNVELLIGECSGIDINPVPVLCENSDPVVLVATPGGGEWNGAPTGIFDPATSGAGIHEVIYTNSMACPEEDTIYIEVLSSPQVVIEPLLMELCASEDPYDFPIIATGSEGDGNYTFTWNTPGGTQFGSTVFPESSGNYSVTVSDGNTCFSSTSMEVLILPNPSVSLIDPGPICNNLGYSIQIDADPYGGIFSGSFITQDGILYPYELPDTTFSIYYEYFNEFDCASSDSLVIDIIGVPDAIPTNNSPVCAGSQILLFGNSDPIISGATYIWSGPGSYVSADQNPTDATEEGYYYLELFVNGCITDPAFTEVVFTDAPEVEMSGGVLGCDPTPVEISANSNLPGSTFSWSGPNGFTSGIANPMVLSPGYYYVTVALDSTCVTVDSVEVLLDESPPDISGNGNVLTCANDSIQITSSSTNSDVTYFWNGPNGFSSNQQNPFVYIPGEYQVFVTGMNGCSDSLIVEVTSNDIYPIITTYNDTLNCNITDINLDVDVDLSSVTYSWSGPASYSSTDPSPSVSGPGVYFVTVTSDEGCSTIASLDILLDTITIPLNTHYGSLSCAITETEIGVTELPAGANVFWSGPGGFSSNDSLSMIDSAGDYIVEVVFTNGCSRIEMVSVDQDITPPPFTIGGDTIISCLVGFASLNGESPVSNAGFEWKNENGITLSTGEMLSVGSEGSYTLIVTNPENGCADSATIAVVKDQNTPNIEASGDTLNCIETSVFISASSDAKIFAWEGPNGYTSNLATNQVSMPGNYSVTVTGDNGCIAVETVSVFDDTEEPQIVLENEIIDCNNPEITISLTATGNENSYSWLGPGGFASGMEDPSVTESGLYIVTVTSSNGCWSVDSILVNENVQIPVLTTDFSNDLTCIQTETTITASSDSTVSSFLWIGPGGFSWDQASKQVTWPGMYYVTITAENGCENKDSIYVPIDTISPGIQISSEDLDCTNPQVTINTIISNDQNPEFHWTGPNGFTSSQENPVVTIGGEYFITVTNDNGCQNTANIYIDQDDNVPVTEIDVIEFDCDGSDAQLSGTLIGMNYIYEWVGPDGSTFNGQMITVDEGGIYTLTIIDDSNGCSYTVSTNLDKIDPVSGFSLETTLPGCKNEFGSILITNVEGGDGDIQYSIDGGANYQSSNSFIGLLSGDYEVLILDDNDCSVSQNVILTELFDFEAVIETDLNLIEGEELQLIVEVPIDTSEIDTIIWTPADNLSCTNCLNPIFSGNQTTVITVTVIDVSGCLGEARAKIKVQERELFVPNVFSPNEDGVNDYLTIFGNEKVYSSIRELSIYDRWGNRLHTKRDFSLNSAIGWDGKSNGSFVNEGVYVYYIIVEKHSGKLLTRSGDVTVLR